MYVREDSKVFIDKGQQYGCKKNFTLEVSEFPMFIGPCIVAIVDE